MQRKPTITIDEQVAELDHPHVVHLHPDLEAAYAKMVQDEAREAAALEWTEAMVGDVIET